MKPRAGSGEVAAAQAGFTLLELLTVLAILSILLGISLGVFTRATPRYELARNELLDKLRRARLFATAERAPAAVILRPGVGDDWPTISAIGRQTLGTWHLEGVDLSGFGGRARGDGYEEDPQGVLGRACRLAANLPSFLEFGPSAAFESPDGFVCEMFVKLDDDSARRLMRKGDMFFLEVDSDGFLKASVELLPPGAPRGESVDVAVTSEQPCLFPGRWTEISASFDGLALRVAVDGATVAETLVQEFHDLSLDPKAALVVGDRETPFSGSVDEVQWGVFVEESSEGMVDMELVAGRGASLVRFAPGGELDGRFHSAPVSLQMVDIAGNLLEVTVGLLGDVN